mgnify:CR=1 FL=1
MAITIAAFVIALVVGIIVFTKIINESEQALVERLGKYNRTMKPGINFLIPGLETIVWQETLREKFLDVPVQETITQDGVYLRVDAVVFWKILDIRRAYYEIDDVEKAIENLTMTTLRSQIGEMKLQDTFSSRNTINQGVLKYLDEVTENWGVKVTRVEIQDLLPSPVVLDSMQQEKAAALKKQASILEAQGTVEYMDLVSEALASHPNAKDILNFLLAQKYLDTNFKLGESPNSKILFMDPKAMSEALSQLMKSENRNPNQPD